MMAFQRNSKAKNGIASEENYCKGEAFWYKIGGKGYCGVVLDIEKAGFYLVALTEEVNEQSLKPDDLLSLECYTLAWFSDVEMLSRRRIRKLCVFEITGSYNGRAGAFFSAEKIKVHNYGSKGVWRHETRNYHIPHLTVGDALTHNNIPKFYINL